MSTPVPAQPGSAGDARPGRGALSKRKSRTRPLRTAAWLVLLLGLMGHASACSPCARTTNQWQERLRESTLATGAGQQVATGASTHIVLNLSEAFFDELISANLEIVDPPDATTDIAVLDDDEQQIGIATVSVQLRPQTLRVTLDESVFLHSALNVVVQVKAPGLRETQLLEGTAKTLVTLVPDPNSPTHTIIQAGGLTATSIHLPDAAMDDAWPRAFIRDLRGSVAQLVTRSTSTVRRAIDVLQIALPSPSTVQLRAVVTGLRQPTGTDRVLVSLATNLRVGPGQIELNAETIDEEASAAGPDELVVYLHRDLPKAWLNLAFAANPSAWVFSDDGQASDPPGYYALPSAVKPTFRLANGDTPRTTDDAGPRRGEASGLAAEFRLFRTEEAPCRAIERTVTPDLAALDWGNADLSSLRMVSLEDFVERAFFELLFAGRFVLGTRELIWTPRYAPRDTAPVWRFAGHYDVHELTIEPRTYRGTGVERFR